MKYLKIVCSNFNFIYIQNSPLVNDNDKGTNIVSKNEATNAVTNQECFNLQSYQRKF
jgi:hypothetical protein